MARQRMPFVSLLLITALAGHAGTSVQADARPLKPIASLDVERYMGRWYEIAKFPNHFQKKCVADTQAEYRLVSGAGVQVVNRCRMANGQISQASAVAKQMGGTDSPRLKVRFAPAWLSFIPAVWGDYWVVDIDEAYQLVAVSEPEREYLWILSRSQKVAPAPYQALLQRLQHIGFDTGRLESTPHPTPD
jgi:apolipoprotein D and lipocalin family protein